MIKGKQISLQEWFWLFREEKRKKGVVALCLRIVPSKGSCVVITTVNCKSDSRLKRERNLVKEGSWYQMQNCHRTSSQTLRWVKQSKGVTRLTKRISRCKTHLPSHRLENLRPFFISCLSCLLMNFASFTLPLTPLTTFAVARDILRTLNTPIPTDKSWMRNKTIHNHQKTIWLDYKDNRLW